MSRDEIRRYLKNVVGLRAGVVTMLMRLSGDGTVEVVRRFANQRRDGMDRAGVALGRK